MNLEIDKKFQNSIENLPIDKEQLNKLIQNNLGEKETMKIFLKKLIKYVYRLLEKEDLPKDKADKIYTTLSIESIINDGEIYYYRPCLHLTVTLLILLKKIINENDIEFIAQGLDSGSFHFGLQFKFKDKLYFADFNDLNYVHIGEGKFKTKYTNKERSVHETVIIKASDINEKMNVNEIEDLIIKNSNDKNFYTKTQEFRKKLSKKYNEENITENTENRNKKYDKYKKMIKEEYIKSLISDFGIPEDEAEKYLEKKEYINTPIIKRVEEKK